MKCQGYSFFTVVFAAVFSAVVILVFVVSHLLGRAIVVCVFLFSLLK